jgi:sortase A
METKTRPRSRRRRLVRACATAAMVIGALAVADGVAALVWQEPITAIAAARAQHRLGSQLETLEARAPAPQQLRVLRRVPGAAARARVAARQMRTSVSAGDPVGRIVMPTLDRSFVVVAGDAAADLRKGPGLFAGTSFPGEGGVTAIAGHRTTYLAPFRKIDQLHQGDPIEVRMPYGTFTYAVTGHRIVKPTQVDVVRRAGHGLVLSACNPVYSAAQRIIVFARQVRFTPNRRALGL